METIVIKVTNPEKSAALLQLLQSMDFVVSAEYVDTLASARRLFNEINQEVAQTPLAELSYDDIQAEIDAYRRGH